MNDYTDRVVAKIAADIKAAMKPSESFYRALLRFEKDYSNEVFAKLVRYMVDHNLLKGTHDPRDSSRAR